MSLEIKTETVTKEVYKTGIYFELDEVKQIVEALYEKDRDSALAHQMNEIHRKFNDAIHDLNRKIITEKEILDNAECSTGNCD
tara:strand:- start:441 stop:689 length:249 start_codon:yes stop_codon:yes gene_type:complete